VDIELVIDVQDGPYFRSLDESLEYDIRVHDELQLPSSGI
jgi:hypothetical protein